MSKIEDIENLLSEFLDELSFEQKVEASNRIKSLLIKKSPFNKEPVECVQWIKSELVVANDYNPNAVAATEMKLLETSILNDGYTQPIVTWKHDGKYEVVDGFHRNIIGKESESVRNRIFGYLPVVVINEQSADRCNRIAATVRHNRARGKHKVSTMSDIIVELRRRRWSYEKIANELGMKEDEIIKLSQISGIADLFKDRKFSQSWEPSSSE
jgi:ParB-like chromosome segregation protein Spo0J